MRISFCWAFIVIHGLLVSLTHALIVSLEVPPHDLPIWSLSTLNSDGNTNMNIMTYIYPVGTKPRITWALSLYEHTLSYQNFVREGWGVAQALNVKHDKLVDLLGRNSGKDLDKLQGLRSLGYTTTTLSVIHPSISIQVLSDASSCVYLRAKKTSVVSATSGPAGPRSEDSSFTGSVVDAGDHRLILCDVLQSWVSESPEQRMTASFLRSRGLY